ncbi:HU family DNA-binding protein [Acinetobacter sp. ANC 5502]
MNKSQLIKKITASANLTQAQATAALQAFETSIIDELANGGEVTLTGFGTFKVIERAARTGRNPKTGESLEIAASKVPSFKAGKALKDALK